MKERQCHWCKKLCVSGSGGNTTPVAFYATLLDDEWHIGSVRSTMYRVLTANDSGADRRKQLLHPAYAKPELLAFESNQIWSWDITKLEGPNNSPLRPSVRVRSSHLDESPS
jgi:hypothetical protein